VSAQSRTSEQVLQIVSERGIKSVRFTFCDLVGITRCKGVQARYLDRKLTEGGSLSRAGMALNMLDELIYIEHMQPVGEFRLIPDLDSFVELPWAPGVASLLCDQVSHAEAGWEACPRRTLKRVVNRLAEQGITAQAAFETEFYVVAPDQEAPGGYRPFPRSPVYSSIGHDAFAGLMETITDALEAQDIAVEQAINEYGPGQLELSVATRSPLQAADEFIRVRDTVRGCAALDGLAASFTPKPFPDQIGSGEHVHISLWSEGRNLLYDPERPGQLSDTGLEFIAGLLEHLPALVAMTTPSFNSYRRFQEGMWASSMTSWGYDNREAAVRVVSPFRGREAASLNVELKPADATANPYLSLASILLAGLDGIARHLQPPEPCTTDPARVPEAEREARRLRPLPQTMGDALDNLERDRVLGEGLGAEIFDAYLALRRSEERRFSGEDAEFELSKHFNVF
jgi:glutamine synthetase